MPLYGRPFRSLFITMTVFFVFGCASSFQPRSIKEVNFLARAQTQSQENYRVKAAVLSAEESKAVFGVPLYKRGIQPIWLEIENRDKKPMWFLPFSVDPDYFSPLEVTYPFHRTFDQSYNDQMDRYFLEHAMGLYLAPGTIRSGFVFTNLDLGTKSFNVDLVGEDNQVKVFTFFIAVPGLKVDHLDIDLDNLYSADDTIYLDENGFRSVLENLPCCPTNADATEQAGPINLVLVGSGDNLLRILLRTGWNETASEEISASSTISFSDDIPTGYRYYPVSPIFYYGRAQDASFRETRATGAGRNVLRLWLSPLRVEGEPVWIGLVNRELGARWLSFKDLKIDLDEVRSFFLQNFAYAQGIKKLGYVKGTEISPISQPQKVFGNISYITDGLRAVIWLSEKPIALNEVEVMNWEVPPAR